MSATKKRILKCLYLHCMDTCFTDLPSIMYNLLDSPKTYVTCNEVGLNMIKYHHPVHMHRHGTTVYPQRQKLIRYLFLCHIWVRHLAGVLRVSLVTVVGVRTFWCHTPVRGSVLLHLLLFRV